MGDTDRDQKTVEIFRNGVLAARTLVTGLIMEDKPGDQSATLSVAVCVLILAEASARGIPYEEYLDDLRDGLKTLSTIPIPIPIPTMPPREAP